MSQRESLRESEPEREREREGGRETVFSQMVENENMERERESCIGAVACGRLQCWLGLCVGRRVGGGQLPATQAIFHRIGAG